MFLLLPICFVTMPIYSFSRHLIGKVENGNVDCLARDISLFLQKYFLDSLMFVQIAEFCHGNGNRNVNFHVENVAEPLHTFMALDSTYFIVNAHLLRCYGNFNFQ